MGWRAILAPVVLLGSALPADTLDLVTFDYYPTMYTQDGEVKGGAVLVVREAARRMGYEVRLTLVPYKRGLSMVENGTTDGMFTVYKTPERETFAYYPEEPVMYRVVSFYALSDATVSFDGDLRRMAVYSIGTVRGYSYGERLDRLILDSAFKAVDPAGDPRDTLRKLLYRRFDLMPHTELDMELLLKEMGIGEKVRKLSPPIERVPTYLIFTRKRETSAPLPGAFVRALRSMRQDGSYARLLRHGERPLE